ncbi:MAG: hypothetical protein LBT46_14800 [Planctomycetaceae bacterium]|jgi:hypothetical protein|nr:hypothetical protein [Planctomycetaceae bacterium]
MSSPFVTAGVRHYFEYFNFYVDVLNEHSPPDKSVFDAFSGSDNRCPQVLSPPNRPITSLCIKREIVNTAHCRRLGTHYIVWCKVVLVGIGVRKTLSVFFLTIIF